MFVQLSATSPQLGSGQAPGVRLIVRLAARPSTSLEAHEGRTDY